MSDPYGPPTPGRSRLNLEKPRAASAPERPSDADPDPFDPDDWVTRAIGGARSPEPAGSRPPTPQAPPSPGPVWGTVPLAPARADAGQKKLVAGVLALLFGWLGVHKFYLGYPGPGLVMLGLSLGVWVVALVLSLLTFLLAAPLVLPLAGLVAGGVWLLGVAEGVIYLSQSDGQFADRYLDGRRPWL